MPLYRYSVQAWTWAAGWSPVSTHWSIRGARRALFRRAAALHSVGNWQTVDLKTKGVIYRLQGTPGGWGVVRNPNEPPAGMEAP